MLIGDSVEGCGLMAANLFYLFI